VITKLPKGSCTVGGLCNEQTQDLFDLELRKPVKYKMTYDIFPDIFMPRSIPCARTTPDIIHFFHFKPSQNAVPKRRKIVPQLTC